MNDNFDSFLVGVIVGAVIMASFLAIAPSFPYQQAKKAIAECEKDLPRNQHCKLVGVPK